MNLSRLIVNFFDKIITPKVYEVTDKSSVVIKTTYDEALNKIEQLEYKIQSERESRLKIQNENEILENRIKEFLDTENKRLINPNSIKTKLLGSKLKEDKNLESFKNMASDILNGIGISKDRENVIEFATLGLIKPGNNLGGGKFSYTLTQSGTDIHDSLILEKIKQL